MSHYIGDEEGVREVPKLARECVGTFVAIVIGVDSSEVTKNECCTEPVPEEYCHPDACCRKEVFKHPGLIAYVTITKKHFDGKKIHEADKPRSDAGGDCKRDDKTHRPFTLKLETDKNLNSA